jgi:hypothetical protein|nr:MAG TPA: hypothetical protein [Caudoviricetes sp.]
MVSKIQQSIDNLKEGQEITIVLYDGRRMSGLYGGMDGNNVILCSQNKQVPSLGWEIDTIEEILCSTLAPAGDVVQIDIVDVKTGRKVAITVDFSSEEGRCDIEFVPGVDCDEKGLYVNLASQFIKMLTH